MGGRRGLVRKEARRRGACELCVMCMQPKSTGLPLTKLSGLESARAHTRARVYACVLIFYVCDSVRVCSGCACALFAFVLVLVLVLLCRTQWMVRTRTNDCRACALMRAGGALYTLRLKPVCREPDQSLSEPLELGPSFPVENKNSLACLPG